MVLVFWSSELLWEVGLFGLFGCGKFKEFVERSCEVELGVRGFSLVGGDELCVGSVLGFDLEF